MYLINYHFVNPLANRKMKITFKSISKHKKTGTISPVFLLPNKVFILFKIYIFNQFD